MTLVFPRCGVDKLLEHAVKSRCHKPVEGDVKSQAPGLWLVKDDGIYLMSNGEPSLADVISGHYVVYAEGHGARGGPIGIDDFCQFIPAHDFTVAQGFKKVCITVADIHIKVEGAR